MDNFKHEIQAFKHAQKDFEKSCKKLCQRIRRAVWHVCEHNSDQLKTPRIICVRATFLLHSFAVELMFFREILLSSLWNCNSQVYNRQH